MTDRAQRNARRVFVDSSAYFALAHQRDAFHIIARDTIGEFRAQRYRFFTTNFTLAELHALLLSRLNREIALVMLREIDASRITTIVRVRQQDERRAREIITQCDDKNFSLVDAISFAVMERLGISQAFSFDQNVAQYGWIMPPADERYR
jgi:predicted nucleic acid-binding protein